METKYSRNKFEGYTHRFVVRFNVGDNHGHSIDIYSNSDCYTKLSELINEKKTGRVLSYEIVHCASKETDDLTSNFIDEVMEKL